MNIENKNQKTIVFAEDDKDIARLVKFKLEREGLNVVHFPDGEGVVDAILQIHPDIVLLDVMMPVQDGISILREIRSNPETADIPVIMLSAKGQEQDIVKGLETGATDYLTKPFAPSELMARINRVLSQER
ncbi:MAG: response regulator transcription factor [Candidatus Methanofastidiosia archaeon]